MDYTGNYYFLDGAVYDNSLNIYRQPEGVAFYEVIRTSNGYPWFFDNHIKRLENGISSKFTLPEGLKETIKTGIKRLATAEAFEEKNLNVTVTFNTGGYSLFIAFVESFYPDKEMYTNGVKMITLKAERHDPGVKIVNASLRMAVNDRLKFTGAYEALLIKGNGIITEGSRSNIFFVDNDNTIVTSPDYLVLPGITRQTVTEICQDEAIKLIYKEMNLSEISCFKSAFITGTSPMVMPVKTIDELTFDASSPLINRLRELYIARAEESIQAFKDR